MSRKRKSRDLHHMTDLPAVMKRLDDYNIIKPDEALYKCSIKCISEGLFTRNDNHFISVCKLT